MTSAYLCVSMLWLIILFLVEESVAFTLTPGSWMYKGHKIAYEVFSGDNVESGRVAADGNKNPIVMLNGFGVGSFHQHRLVENYFKDYDDGRLAFGVDYLGQGDSWPVDCMDGNSENEKGLIYSAETWIDQLILFLEEVVIPTSGASRVHLVGNSVGGHLAAHLAVRRPDLIESVCLLNPTPVWGLNLPGWTGHLPPPAVPRKIGRYLFDRIRDLDTIQKYLENAYSNQEAFEGELKHQIRGCTMGNGGHAAFASILWSPPLTVPGYEKGNFQKCLEVLACDVLLIFGKDDPWCKPAFGKRMLEALDKREPGKVHRYIEIENTGHCPNHESPQAVASIVSKWISQRDRRRSKLTLVDVDDRFSEIWGTTPARELEAEKIKVSMIDGLAARFM